MLRVIQNEKTFAPFFLDYLLARTTRYQEVIMDQLLNSSEKRLARILLIMAEFTKPGERQTYIPPISQETLAEMIGTTRSRVNLFMSKFKRLGFIHSNGGIHINSSLLSVVLHE